WPRLVPSTFTIGFTSQHSRRGDFMSKRLTRSALIGVTAPRTAITSQRRASCWGNFKALPPGEMRSNRPLNTSQPFLTNVHQQQTCVSQSFSSSFSSGIFSLKTDTDFRDTSKTDGKSYVDGFVGNNSKWQENQVGYANSEMNLGETIRLQTRFGASTYDASQGFFNSLGQNKTPEDQRELRFASVRGPASGAAALTHLEADILKLGDAKV